MAKGNFKMAFKSIRAARWRSFLTIAGIVIGTVSVITILSLGEGIKRRLGGQMDKTGQNLVTVLPGRIARPNNSRITDSNLLINPNIGSLSDSDLVTIKSIKSLAEVVPVAQVTGMARYQNQDYPGGLVIATTGGAGTLINQKMLYGSFFADEHTDRKTAVIGKRVAEELFGESAPIGRSFTIRGQTYAVEGVFGQLNAGLLASNADSSRAIIIPYENNKTIGGSQPQIFQILIQPNEGIGLEVAVKTITTVLTAAHAGQTDFTVLTQKESLVITNHSLDIITGFLAAIAMVSLVVGGIGIMNIMFVSVTERTSEIGVRKAIGATNRQILNQFLAEAVILSAIGGAASIIIALVANYFMRVMTDLTPVITPWLMLTGVSMAIIVGLVFGVAPAVLAARKDPIEALRYH